jgi:RNA polymerase sigma-70 factor, ECF subfamily
VWHDAPVSGAPQLAELFDEHRSFLWALCYRLSGSAADADDLVQETFVRALQHPPARTGEPWRPWLVRVAVNLGRDLLRRRKRRGYEGSWLPGPLEQGAETLAGASTPAPANENPAVRYDALESVSLAFLLALEALTPLQRAVLLLRDVFDYSVREAAEALDQSEANVKTTHSRARKRMAAYEASRQPPTPAVQERTQASLYRFLAALQAGDVAAVEAMLSSDVRAVADGGGEFHTARAPIVGPAKVARFYLGLSRFKPVRAEVRVLSGLPSVIVELPFIGPGWAPRAVLQCETDAQGRITLIYSVNATRKLSGVK